MYSIASICGVSVAIEQDLNGKLVPCEQMIKTH